MARYKKPEGISIIYSTRKSSPEYQAHIRSTIGIENVQIIEVVNNGQWGLSELYNRTMESCEHDITVFMHDDLIFETPNWGRKLLRNFSGNVVQIIGLAGVHTEFPMSGCWWQAWGNTSGIVNHIKDGQKFTTVFSPEQGDGIKKALAVDGLFIAARRSQLVHKFDESFTGFHFYDLSFCFPNYLAGLDIGIVTNIRVTHLSVGQTNAEWERNRNQFMTKYADELPCRQQP